MLILVIIISLNSGFQISGSRLFFNFFYGIESLPQQSNNLGKIEGLHHQVKSYIGSIKLDSFGNKFSPQTR